MRLTKCHRHRGRIVYAILVIFDEPGISRILRILSKSPTIVGTSRYVSLMLGCG